MTHMAEHGVTFLVHSFATRNSDCSGDFASVCKCTLPVSCEFVQGRIYYQAPARIATPLRSFAFCRAHISHLRRHRGSVQLPVPRSRVLRLAAVRGWRIADEVVTRPVRRQSPPRNLQQSGSLLGKRRNCPRGGVHSGNLPSLRHQQDTALTGQAPRPAPAAPRVVLNPPSRLDGFVSQGPVFVLEGSDRFQMRGRRMCVSLR